MEWLEATCQPFRLLSKAVKGWTRDGLAVDAQICAGVEASLTALGW